VDNRIVEPYDAIKRLEVSLRGLIRDVLGDDWLSKSAIDRETLEARRKGEAARRKGAAVEQNLLAFTHVYELRKIITRNWDSFEPALADRKRFDVYMDRVEDFRNAPMHGRELLPFEEELLAGIVGEIRNLATLYRSQQGPDSKFYPIVESIVDSFGVTANLSSGATSAEIRLQIGETIEFACRAWDAQDRSLNWRLLKQTQKAVDTATGNNVTLRYTITDADVREHFVLEIEMTSGGKFHRLGKWDFSHNIIYAVDPPIFGGA
jgi:hypothetical protein